MLQHFVVVPKLDQSEVDLMRQDKMKEVWAVSHRPETQKVTGPPYDDLGWELVLQN